jgi:dihydropteroate synthase
MQKDPQYQDVVEDVMLFLEQRKQACVDAGIHGDQVILDPGFGFGKTLKQNLSLLQNLERFHSLGQPLLVGLSRKSMIGAILENTTEERVFGSIACAVIAAMKGASIIRVHDVKQTIDALKVVDAIKMAG